MTTGDPANGVRSTQPGVPGADQSTAPTAAESPAAPHGSSASPAGSGFGSGPSPAATGGYPSGHGPANGGYAPAQNSGGYGSTGTPAAAGYGQSPAGYGSGQVPPAGYGGAVPPSGGEPPTPSQPSSGGGRSGTRLAAGALVLALLAGGVGGAVGAAVANNSNETATVTTSLDQPAASSSDAGSAAAGSVEAVAAKVLPSVVQIDVTGQTGSGEGSGVIISSDGLILTNAHVAVGAGAGASLEVILSDGTRTPAQLVAADTNFDLAVIRVQGQNNLTPIQFGTSGDLVVGQPVVAVGSPLGLAGTVTTGIVSALNRPVSASGDNSNQSTVLDAIQTDAAINPGNSGGALVDMNGNLVGINSAIATVSAGSPYGGQSQSGSIGVGFAIPVDQARTIAQQLIDNGQVTMAVLGVEVQSGGPETQTAGATVAGVTPGGAAEQAGIPTGAVITRLDNRIIDSPNALIAAVRSYQPGASVAVTYTDQGGAQHTAQVTLGSAQSGGR